MSEQHEPRIAMCQQCNGEGYFYGDEVPVRCSTSDAVTQLAMRQTAQIAGLIAELEEWKAAFQRTEANRDALAEDNDKLIVENERLRAMTEIASGKWREWVISELEGCSSFSDAIREVDEFYASIPGMSGDAA